MKLKRRHNIDLFVARCFGYSDKLMPHTCVVMHRYGGKIFVLASELTITAPEHPEREWRNWPPSFLTRK